MMQRVIGSRWRLIAAAVALLGFVPPTILAQATASRLEKAAELILAARPTTESSGSKKNCTYELHLIARTRLGDSHTRAWELDW